MTDLNALRHWGCAVLNWDEGVTELDPVPGDASFRRYFRLLGPGGRAILCDAPPAREKNAEFVAVAALFDTAGVRVPRVHGVDLERGWLCLEDLGDQLLLPLLSDTTADAYYEEALGMLRMLAAVPDAAAELAPYSHALLMQELELFPEWFCHRLLAMPLDADARRILDDLFAVLCERALGQLQVAVHRDFHARNLMVVDSGEGEGEGDSEGDKMERGHLAAIDFQDAVFGPVCYDPVSLLRDCYLRWPSERVRAWALFHRDTLLADGLNVPREDAAFLRDFDYMGLQRHIKVLGIFARLWMRDGKDAYLRDLPRVMGYVRDVLALYADEPAVVAFARWFDAAALPLAQQQIWYRPS